MLKRRLNQLMPNFNGLNEQLGLFSKKIKLCLKTLQYSEGATCIRVFFDDAVGL